jgi:hypothetical protein
MADTCTVMCRHRALMSRVSWQQFSTSPYISECIAKLFPEALSNSSRICWYYPSLNEIPFYQQLHSSNVGFGNLLRILRVRFVERNEEVMSSKPFPIEAESSVSVVVLGVNFNSVRSGRRYQVGMNSIPTVRMVADK